MKKSYRDLFVWSTGVDFATEVYKITANFPRHEQFGLTAQMRAAAVSIASNIAEGQGRVSIGEWVQFLGHARGSLHEVETQLEIARRLGYATDAIAQGISEKARQIGSGLSHLIDYARNRKH